ncbi:MAG: ABC transporter permease [Paludibacteraceae bacterium]|nr:ABC transporter permease [Paludibacteraceae bacterium]
MYRKELTYYFTSPIAYIVIGLYLLLISLFLWIIPGEWNIIDSGYAQTDGLFQLSPWLFLFLCPALTMRLFSEERQRGTWNVLLTKPVSLTKIVVAKFAAAWTLVLIALLPCITHIIAVYMIAEPYGNVDIAAFCGSFIGLMLISLAFVAIGTFCSSFSKNQIVCFIISVIGCAFFYYGFDLTSSLVSSAQAANIVQSLGGHTHFSSLARGVIDLSDVAYFIVATVFFIVSTIFSVQYKND